MKEMIERLLNGLVTRHNSTIKPIITGYNYFHSLLLNNNPVKIILSNIHDCAKYLEDVSKDIHHFNLNLCIPSINYRDKRGYFQWKDYFLFRNEDGYVIPGLNISDYRTRKKLVLEDKYTRTLKESGYSVEDCRDLIAQDLGYEIDIFINSIEGLTIMAGLFSRKSYCSRRVISKENGTATEIQIPDCWTNAWKEPFILVQKPTVLEDKPIKDFALAYLYKFEHRTIGEYYFIINKNIALFKQTPEHHILGKIGFQERTCLISTPFLKYIDFLSDSQNI